MFSSEQVRSATVQVKSTEVSEELETTIKSLAKEALTKYRVERDIAKHIKTALDEKGGVWHVIVGRNFGSYVTHDRDYFIHFNINDISFLVYRIG